MANLEIRGQVKLLNADSPMQNLKFELWDSVTDGYGLLCNTVTDVDGYYICLLDDPIASLVVATTIVLKYKIYRNGVLVKEAVIPDYTLATTITISESALDNSTIEEDDSKSPSFIAISGAVNDINGAAVAGITVNVYEIVFPSKQLVARTKTDVLGKYVIKVNKRLLSNSAVPAKRGLIVAAEDNEIPANVTTSSNIFDWEEKGQITIDLRTSTVNAQPAYQNIIAAVTTIIDATPVAELTSQQIDYLANATGCDAADITNIVTAHQLADETSLPADYIHALVQLGSHSIDTIASLKPADTRNIINMAISQNVIQGYTEAEIDTFIADLKVYQIQRVKDAPIAGEPHSMNDVLESIFPVGGDVDNFLSLYLDDFESMSEFWNELYIPAYGEAAAKNAQDGLKLAAITSFQPKIMSRLKVEIAGMSTPHISQLAKWSQEDWATLISDVCTAETELCVPASIRGEETDYENTAIHEQYAIKLVDIMHRAYPLTNIAGTLEGVTGETLIADATVRTKVSSFINANPLLDLRMHSIHDINAEDYDIDEADVEDVKNGLAPFQRLLRLVDGNPVAVSTLIADGVNSAKAISEMGKEEFLETYGDLFPIGESTTSVPLHKSHVFSGFGSGLPTGSMVYGSAYATVTASTLGLTSGILDSLSTGPAFPPTFPGGYTTLPSDYPILSSLFGGTDYCNCCDCKSVLSPAAYLTDMLHFLQTKAPAIYSALLDKRPDLVNIDLSCKNSDTPMSYIDLVTELLELEILKPKAADPVSDVLQCDILLKPEMQVIPNETADPHVAGYYSYILKEAPGFINVYPLSDYYMTPNYVNYQTLDRLHAGYTEDIHSHVGSPFMYDKLVQYHLDFSDGTDYMLVWSDFSGTGGMTGPGATVTYEDTALNNAMVAPFIIFDSASQNVIEYLIGDIAIEVVATTASSMTLRLIRTHNDAPPAVVDGINMYWMGDAGSGVPDPEDALNTDKTLLTLTPGTYTIGVGTDYDITDYAGSTVISSKHTMVISINTPTYIPGGDFTKFSFQTSGTEEQLKAYPERTYKDPVSKEYKDFHDYAAGIPYKHIYGNENLGGAVYPFSLPFSLAKDETRTYLQHFGTSRYELMKLFKPVNQDPAVPAPSDSITDYSLYAEWFGLSQVAASIVTGAHPSIVPYLWTFYGFSANTAVTAGPDDLIIRDPNSYAFIDTTTTGWQDILSSRLDILLQQTTISYEQLLEILSTDYLNPYNSEHTARKISIVPIPSAPPYPGTPVNTCKLDKLKLLFSDMSYQAVFYDKLHRFIRLINTGKLSVYQWDILLRSLYITDINENTFRQLGRVLLLSDELGIPPEILACWWSRIDRTVYRSFANGKNEVIPSLYARTFSNKAVINYDNINYFKNPLDLPTFIVPGTPSVSLVPQVASMCGLEEEEVIQLLDFYGPVDLTTSTVSLDFLSRFYIISILSKKWGYSVSEFIAVMNWLSEYGTAAPFILILPTPTVSDPIINTYIGNLEHFSEVIKAIKLSGFTIAEIDYLIRHKDDEKVIAPDAANIKAFYEKIRADLKNQPAFPPDVVIADLPVSALEERLRNIVYQHFSSEFKMPVQWVATILYSNTSEHNLLISNCIKKDFVRSTYSLSEDSIALIDASPVLPGEPLYPGDDVNLKPDFNLYSLYDWYRYCHKVLLIANRQKLRLKEFEYLFFYGSALQFNFIKLPVSTSINTVEGTAPASANSMLDGILRLSKLMEFIRQLSLPESSLGSIADASMGVVSPDIVKYSPISNEEGELPPAAISVSDPDYNDKINICYENWLAEINKSGWGSMLAELIGDSVSAAGTTETTDSPGVPALLKVYFSADAGISDFSLTEYQNISLVARITDIIYWCKRIGMNPLSLHKLFLEEVTLTDSRNLIIAAKGKYNDAQWAKVAQPLRDKVRKKQRDALIAYTLTKPNVIYGNMLIDIEMDACMVTSRVKQAISSIQLLVDRVIMGIEYSDDDPGTTPVSLITMPQTAKAQWEQWRKWYGIWHANREVFLYPENWMIPELRDNKSFMFEELEEQLKQDEVTSDKAESAIKAYLEKLDGIGRLEPVGACFESYYSTSSPDMVITSSPDINTIHVFSRTYGASHAYYHRKLQPNGIWTPWGKIDINITGKHVVPCFWKNRLFLFWVTITEKLVPRPTPGTVSSVSPYNTFFNNEYDRPMLDSGMSTTGGGDNFKKVLDITLNWTEYKNGTWQNQKTSSENISLQLRHSLQDSIEGVYNPTTSALKSLYTFLTNNNQESITEFIKSRIYIQPKIATTDTTSYFGDAPTPGDLYVMVMFPTLNHPIYEFADPLMCFHVNGDNATVPRSTELNNRLVPTEHTFFKNQALVSFRNPYAVTTEQLRYDTYYNYSAPSYRYPTNSSPYIYTHWRSGGTTILGKTPDNKSRIFPRSGFKNPLGDSFMYEDQENTYFVRLANVNFSHLLSSDGTAIGIGSAATIAEWWYLDGTPEEGGGSASVGVSPYAGSTPHAGGFTSSGSPLPKYLFQTFYHPQVKKFIEVLNVHGLQGLMRPDLLPTPLNIQNPADTMAFSSKYLPNSEQVAMVDMVPGSGTPPLNRNQIPKNTVDFFYNGTYSSYNWELFYHIPMLIAEKLSTNHQFKEAQQWYHYIFDPTKYAPVATPGKFWVFQPFYEIASTPITTLDDLLARIHAGSEGALAEVSASSEDPFQPYAIGRLRPLAFMKNTLMKYLDNLIAWGDSLFGRDTIESINEATQLYILASNILGSKPKGLSPRAETRVYSYKELNTPPLWVDEIGEASVPIETYIAPSSVPPPGSSGGLAFNVSYFCLTPNDKLLEYWDKVADRLFKIRNCQNLEGKKRDLAIFETPIDPGLLVQAAAQGLDINDVLDEMSGSGLPNYRFTYILQKANEFCADVKALGSSLLSALEKKDAEAISLLRQGHEAKLLDAVLQMKKVQVEEAEANLESLKKSKENIVAREEYYSSKEFMNANEKQHLQLLKKGIDLQRATLILQEIGAAVSLIPQFHATPLAVGASFGGQQLSTMVNMGTMMLSSKAAVNNIIGSMASTQGRYQRRMEDWKFQERTAQMEAEQMDKQITAAMIRVDVAEKDYENQKLQIENSKETDLFLQTKYSNVKLYDWMVKEISTTYFSAFRMAKEMARKAERCYKKELPLSEQATGGFIRNNSWSNLRSGLLSGEKLQYDLRNMEAAYISDNKRTLELTKHVSLAMLNATELLTLKHTGECNISIPEALYDMDYPNHYNRIIKSISVSIPCVAGPYATVPCTISYITSSSKIRSAGTGELTAGPVPVCSTIATSSAQNDNGVFDFSFRDERYLPFEGAGAICTLNIKLGGITTSDGKTLRPFDYATISDVIVHVKYTALEGTETGADRSDTIYELINSGDFVSEGVALPRIFSLKHEFPNEWFAFKTQVMSGATDPLMELPLKVNHFPFFNKRKTINITEVVAATKLKGDSYDITINESGVITGVVSDSLPPVPITFDPGVGMELSNSIPATTIPLSIKEAGVTPPYANLDMLEDIYLVVMYTVASPITPVL